MSHPTQYVLDPWSDEIRFIAVPTDYMVVRIPKPMRHALRDYLGSAPMFSSPEYAACHRKPYASKWLRWEGYIYVAEEDEARLLVALRAAERAILLLALLSAHGRPALP